MSTQQDIYNITQDVSLIEASGSGLCLYVLGKLSEDEFKSSPYMSRLVDLLKTFEEEKKSLGIAKPNSFYAKELSERIYRTIKEFDEFISASGEEDKFRKYNWKDDKTKVYKALDDWKKGIKPYVDRAKEDVGKTMQYLGRLGHEGKLTGSAVPQRKGKPKAAVDEATDMTTVGKVVAMLAVLALGFAMLSGLNNLSRAAAGYGLQSLDTGFYLLPGGPFITSLQMVLFMLSSVIVIVYLFGKSFGEW